MRSSLMRSEWRAGVVAPSGVSNGARHQSAPSAVALTEEACTAPEQNSIPALTHLHVRAGSRRGRIVGVVRRPAGEERDNDSGVAPVKMTRPP